MLQNRQLICLHYNFFLFLTTISSKAEQYQYYRGFWCKATQVPCTNLWSGNMVVLNFILYLYSLIHCKWSGEFIEQTARKMLPWAGCSLQMYIWIRKVNCIQKECLELLKSLASKMYNVHKHVHVHKHMYRLSYEKSHIGIKATVFKCRIFTRSQRSMKLFFPL